MSKLIALAGVALAMGASTDDAWVVAQEANKHPEEETAYREAARLAGEKAFARFGQA